MSRICLDCKEQGRNLVPVAGHLSQHCIFHLFFFFIGFFVDPYTNSYMFYYPHVELITVAL